ncbi:MAG: hypothetical protein IJG00_01925 [Clostridia bacterium]|nr:hypothetical protein [Clostridia bacterium]
MSKMKPRQKGNLLRKLKNFIKSKALAETSSFRYPHSQPNPFSLLEPTFKLTTTLLLMIQEKYAQTSYTSLPRLLGHFLLTVF